MSDRTSPSGIGFLYETAAAKHKEQMDWVDALDTKAGVLLAAGGLVVGLVLREESALVSASSWVALSVVLALLLSLLLALLAFGTRRYELAPDLNELWTQLGATTDEELKWLASPSILEAIEINQPKIDQKAAWLFWSAVMLLTGAMVFLGWFGWSILIK